MISHRLLIPRRLRAGCRAAGLLLLCMALLSPKVSLALNSLLDNGYRSVIICTGSGLKRVTISPDGGVTEDVSQAWVSPACVLVSDQTESLQRAWQHIGYPQLVLLASSRSHDESTTTLSLLSQLSNRGPPAVL